MVEFSKNKNTFKIIYLEFDRLKMIQKLNWNNLKVFLTLKVQRLFD